MKKVKLRMDMFRPLKGSNYNEIYKSDYATFVYVALRILAKSGTPLITTPKQLFLALASKEPTKANIKGIKEGLELLEKEGIIFFNKLENTYQIETDGLEIAQGDYYFNVPLEYLFKVTEQKNSIKLMHHYVLLCSTINVQNHTGSHDRTYFANALGINSLKTITERHKLFVDLEIIFFSEHRNGVDKNGDFVNMPKIYVFPEYKNLVEKVQEEKLNRNTKSKNREVKKVKKESTKKFKETIGCLIKEIELEEAKKNKRSWIYTSGEESPF